MTLPILFRTSIIFSLRRASESGHSSPEFTVALLLLALPLLLLFLLKVELDLKKNGEGGIYTKYLIGIKKCTPPACTAVVGPSRKKALLLHW